jgi:hypothetical protein
MFQGATIMTTVIDKPITTVEVKPFMAKFHKPVPADSEVNQISAGCKFATTYTSGGDTAADYKCDF